MKSVEVTYLYGAGDAYVRERPTTGAVARERLDNGNRAFAALLDTLHGDGETSRRIIRVDPHDLGMLKDEEGAPKQRPFAAVLGCSDARVPVELIFSEGPNDLFVVRVAGNGLGSEVMGSLNYAAQHLGQSLKLIVVLGHSGCGAVSAAVDVFLNPQGYFALTAQHALRSIVDRLLVVVHASARKLSEVMGAEVSRRAGYREALIEMTVASNAALAAHTIQQEVGNHDAQDLCAAYGVYLLASREVWAPRAGSDSCRGLAEPPRDLAAFGQFGDALVGSERIAKILGGDAR